MTYIYKLLLLKNYSCNTAELNCMSFGVEECRQRLCCKWKEENGNLLAMLRKAKGSVGSEALDWSF
jgi:hypothetical protein